MNLCISVMGAAGILRISRTEEVFKNIILFWVLCALDEKCLEPTRKLNCNYTKLRKNKFAGTLLIHMCMYKKFYP